MELVDRAPTFAELTISRYAADDSQVLVEQVSAAIDSLPAGDYPALWAAMEPIADRLLEERGWSHESGWMRNAAEAPWEDGGTCGEAWLSCAVLPSGTRLRLVGRILFGDLGIGGWPVDVRAGITATDQSHCPELVEVGEAAMGAAEAVWKRRRNVEWVTPEEARDVARASFTQHAHDLGLTLEWAEDSATVDEIASDAHAGAAAFAVSVQVPALAVQPASFALHTDARQVQAEEVRSHRVQLKALAAEHRLGELRVRADGTLIVSAPDRGYRAISRFVTQASELTGRYVHVVAADAPDAQGPSARL